jgi:ADP-ribosyl-[dinitrogen reductase] hydrolase
LTERGDSAQSAVDSLMSLNRIELSLPNESRTVAALIGLALGDALGTTVEFAPPGSFEPITDLVGGGPFNLKAGQWTDDTSMALCLATSLVTCQGFDPADQMQRYLRWYRDGYLSSTGQCFDIGNTVQAALSRFARDANPIAGSPSPRSAGNGSLMRLAPVPMAWSHDMDVAVAMAAVMSRTTHGAVEAVDACRYYTTLLVGAINGMDRAELLERDYQRDAAIWQGAPLAPGVALVAEGSFRHKEPPHIRGTGYVVHSLEAALWALYRADSFAHGALLAANLGDDADTTAAIYGQLAGPVFGYDALPSAWLERLTERPFIETLGCQLYHLKPEPFL